MLRTWENTPTCLISEKESEQQGADMCTIHISICQYYDFVIAKGILAEFLTLKFNPIPSQITNRFAFKA